MTPVAQDLNHPSGNCLQAAVASVLDLPLDAVPDFAGEGDNNPNWYSDLVRWATDKGYGVVHFLTPQDSLIPSMHGVWVVAVGHAVRDGVLHPKTHAVVARVNTDPFTRQVRISYEHDPHPSQAFIEEPKYIILFTKQ